MSQPSGVLVQMNKSHEAFVRHIEPILKDKLPGTYYPMETITDSPIAKDFDTKAGIDMWAVLDDKDVMVGIASRVQFDKEWKSFTMRLDTPNSDWCEYGKRKFAIENGYLYPTYALQGYVIDDKLKSFAMVKTRDLVDMVEGGNCKRMENHSDGNRFYVIFWDDIKKQNKDIFIYSDQGVAPTLHTGNGKL